MSGLTIEIPASTETQAVKATLLERARTAVRGLHLHTILFVAFTLIAALPVAVLATWEERTSFQKEMDAVRERHLLVARNLTSTLSRYVEDVQSVVSMALANAEDMNRVAGLNDLLRSLDIIHLCILEPDGTVQDRGNAHLPPGSLDLGRRRELVALAAQNPTPNRPMLTSLEHLADGRPVFYLVESLSGGRVGIGVFGTDYLVRLQQQIAFGDHGHAVIVDNKGRVIAHPIKDWVKASKDLSGVDAVQSMIEGKTGVGTFYSPAFNGDMVAGYAVVPGVGWGVMVPQPIAELQRRAHEVTSLALTVAIVSFAVAALLSWVVAYFLSGPVRQVARTADEVLAGDETACVPEPRGWVPFEIRRLGQCFNRMLENLRQRNAQTVAALGEARQSSLAKSQFLANMSHEMRTPLNGVVGMLELLGGTELTNRQRHFIEGANRASTVLLGVIDDILDLSKIEAGKLELERRPFPLSRLMDETRGLFAPAARTKGLELTVIGPDGLSGLLVGDEHRLQQILGNLASNALKFTSQGGVSIVAACLEQSATEARLRFAVTDTGIGIPQEKQVAIFQAFTQADSSTTRQFGGTGLGLSIAQELVHMMGGQIGVESAVGRGSTFWFTMTLERQPDPAAASPPPKVQDGSYRPRPGETVMVTSGRPTATAPSPFAPIAPAGRDAARSVPASSLKAEFARVLRELGHDRIRVMLVEDNESNLMVTQALLESLGCVVMPARHGVEAVELFRSTSCDLILMDCQMPVMDGYDATRAIRAIEAASGAGCGDRPHTPIVALTANALTGSREESIGAGMDDLLTKPLTLSALVAKLSFWMQASERTRTETATAG